MKVSAAGAKTQSTNSFSRGYENGHETENDYSQHTVGGRLLLTGGDVMWVQPAGCVHACRSVDEVN